MRVVTAPTPALLASGHFTPTPVIDQMQSSKQIYQSIRQHKHKHKDHSQGKHKHKHKDKHKHKHKHTDKHKHKDPGQGLLFVSVKSTVNRQTKNKD